MRQLACETQTQLAVTAALADGVLHCLWKPRCEVDTESCAIYRAEAQQCQLHQSAKQ